MINYNSNFRDKYTIDQTVTAAVNICKQETVRFLMANYIPNLFSGESILYLR